MTLATTGGKEAALDALHQRRENQPEQINNAQLPAGAPMYFYCINCGHLADTLPETYTSIPRKLCDECGAMKDLGWLE